MNDFKIWDFWADKYEKLWVQKYSLGPTRREILKYLTKILEKDKKYKIVDIGCGTGQTIREIKDFFSGYYIEITGVDISEKMIQIAKEKDEISTYINVSIEEFDVKESYDIVLCSHSFPYYKNKEEVIEKFSKILNDEGILLLTGASVNSIYDSMAMFFVKFTTGSAKYLSIKEMLKLVKDRFEKLEVVIIKEKFYMPSICLFILKKEGKK